MYRRRAGLWLLVVVSVAQSSFGQRLSREFIIEQAKPWVYIAFDHVAEDRGGDSGTLWLRLVNNCRIPIQVQTFQFGEPNGGVGLNYEVVPVLGIAEEAPPQSVPKGYSFHVSSIATIDPGRYQVFRALRQQVSKQWFLEAAFSLLLPTPKGGVHPRSVVTFGWDDLPVDLRRMATN